MYKLNFFYFFKFLFVNIIYFQYIYAIVNKFDSLTLDQEGAFFLNYELKDDDIEILVKNFNYIKFSEIFMHNFKLTVFLNYFWSVNIGQIAYIEDEFLIEDLKLKNSQNFILNIDNIKYKNKIFKFKNFELYKDDVFSWYFKGDIEYNSVQQKIYFKDYKLGTCKFHYKFPKFNYDIQQEKIYYFKYYYSILGMNKIGIPIGYQNENFKLHFIPAFIYKFPICFTSSFAVDAAYKKNSIILEIDDLLKDAICYSFIDINNSFLKMNFNIVTNRSNLKKFVNLKEINEVNIGKELYYFYKKLKVDSLLKSLYCPGFNYINEEYQDIRKFNNWKSLESIDYQRFYLPFNFGFTYHEYRKEKFLKISLWLFDLNYKNGQFQYYYIFFDIFDYFNFFNIFYLEKEGDKTISLKLPKLNIFKTSHFLSFNFEYDKLDVLDQKINIDICNIEYKAFFEKFKKEWKKKDFKKYKDNFIKKAKEILFKNSNLFYDVFYNDYQVRVLIPITNWNDYLFKFYFNSCNSISLKYKRNNEMASNEFSICSQVFTDNFILDFEISKKKIMTNLDYKFIFKEVNYALKILLDHYFSTVFTAHKNTYRFGVKIEFSQWMMHMSIGKIHNKDGLIFFATILPNIRNSFKIHHDFYEVIKKIKNIEKELQKIEYYDEKNI